MELGLFQLENLVGTRTPFCFLALEPFNETLPTEIQVLVQKATQVQSANVEAYLREQRTPAGAPIVLLCKDGRASKELAAILERAGFQNIYTVARGIAGLLSEV